MFLSRGRAWIVAPVSLVVLVIGCADGIKQHRHGDGGNLHAFDRRHRKRDDVVDRRAIGKDDRHFVGLATDVGDLVTVTGRVGKAVVDCYLWRQVSADGVHVHSPGRRQDRCITRTSDGKVGVPEPPRKVSGAASQLGLNVSS